MRPVRTEQFTHENAQYEAQVSMDETGYRVQTFRDGRLLGRYSVTFEKESNFETYAGRAYTGTSAVDELVKIAKSDVVLGHVKAR